MYSVGQLFCLDFPAFINVSYNTSISDLLDISGSAQFDAYKFQRERTVINEAGQEVVESGRRVNTYLFSEGEGLVRLTSFNVNLRTSLTSDMFYGDEDEQDTTETQAFSQSPLGEDTYDYFIQWRMSLGYNYSFNQANPDRKTKNSGINASFEISPTPKWKVSASTFYDVFNKEFRAPEFFITRDLHCWQLSFRWVPIGEYRSYYLNIGIKAPQLQDIKIERQGRDRGVY